MGVNYAGILFSSIDIGNNYCVGLGEGFGSHPEALCACIGMGLKYTESLLVVNILAAFKLACISAGWWA